MTTHRIPSPALAFALDAYGRAFCRLAHLDTAARRAALAAAEQAVLRAVDGDGGAVVEPDSAARQHVPRGLLDGAGG